METGPHQERLPEDGSPAAEGRPPGGATIAARLADRRRCAASSGGLHPGLYDAVMWPAEVLFVRRWRRRLYAAAGGAPGARLLEIGAGTGAGLRFVPPGSDLVAVEPARALAARARARAAATRVTVVEACGEKLPFADASFDAALATLTLCSVSEPRVVLAELRRVLRPHGRLLVLEHVHNTWQPARRLQSLFAPAWRRVAQGCRLDQDTVALIEAAGFVVEQRREHLLGWIVELEARR